MLKDITIGQHFPGHSILHRCDPRLKLVATIAYIVVLFVAPNPLGLALSILLLAALYKVAQIPGKMILKSLKPIVPIVIFTAVLNLFFVTGQGEPLVHFWVLNIYVEGVKYAILLAVRVCALIAGTSLLTYTTSPIVLTDAIESLLRPLAKLHFPVHELAMMMTIALRFIPTLIDHGGVGGVVDGVSDRVVQVVRDGNPDHLGHALKRHDKHQHTGDGKGQRGEQDPRACLAGQSPGVLNQLTDDEVGRHDEHRGDQLQGRQKAKIKLEDIGEVVL